MGEGIAIFFCFVPLIIFAVHIALAVWVYKDAKKRGENEVLWLIVFLAGGIIGLIIWLIVRPDENKIGSFGYDSFESKNIRKKKPDTSPTGVQCPKCGNKTIVVSDDDSAYCKICDYAVMDWDGEK